MPAVAHPAELTTIPILGLLLYATFLSVPFAKIGQAFRDWRFLSTVLVVNVEDGIANVTCLPEDYREPSKE